MQAFDRPGEFKFVHLSENRVQHQAEFQPRKVGAGTEMLTFAECNLLVRHAPDVKSIWLLEDFLVAIGRGQPGRELVAGADLFPA